MTDIDDLRIEGVYRQRQAGLLMVRVKVPVSLTWREAESLAEIADEFSSGVLHLTTRGCVELHGVTDAAAASLLAALREAGMTSRGACGGAVRGVACGFPDAVNFPLIREVASALHSRFTGDLKWERFPKKFKIGVFSGCEDLRYLIQDFSLVHAGGKEPLFHAFCAGGLGREPQEAFPLASGVAAEEATDLVERVAAVYAENTPRGKRLKHLVREKGREEFLRLVGVTAPERAPELPLSRRVDTCIEVAPFAGELPSASLRQVAEIAFSHAGGLLFPTADQNIALVAPTIASMDAAAGQLAAAGLHAVRPGAPASRICPGSHECRLGLSATRDIASSLLPLIPCTAGLFAISGCPNSCSQPQLADVGLVTVRGGDEPLFDLYRRETHGRFSTLVSSRLPLSDVVSALLPS
jgi:sulfite reductase (ferredoxin)